MSDQHSAQALCTITGPNYSTATQTKEGYHEERRNGVKSIP